MLKKTRTYAVTTPKLGQDRKVAAIRDAWGRRRLRVFLLGPVSRTLEPPAGLAMLGVLASRPDTGNRAMAGFGDLLQKAFYMGVGIASYLPEVANRETLNELRDQAQKLAEELVSRGEMTAEEAKHTVEEMLQQAQDAVQQVADSTATSATTSPPRPIEIVVEEVTPEGEQPVQVTSKVPTQATPESEADVEALRQRVVQLQEELSRLQQNTPDQT